MIRTLRRLLPVQTLLVLVFAAPASAQITPEITLDRRSLRDLELAPDRRAAAFVVQEPVSGTDQPQHVFLFQLGADSARQLTSSSRSEWSPRFAPDGRSLAFLSDRVDRPQIWLLPLDGGEARPLTKGKSAVRQFAWAPDGRRIAFVAAPPPTDEEEQRRKDKDDARVVDRDDRPASLWLLDLPSGEVHRMTAAPWTVRDLVWLPSGDRLALIATDHPESDRWTEALYTIGVRDSIPRLVAAPTGPIGGLEVSPDGALLSYQGARVDGPVPHDLYLLPLAGGPARNLTAGTIDRPVQDYRWEQDGTLDLLYPDGFEVRRARLTTGGRSTALPTPSPHPSDAVTLADGSLLFVGQTATRAPELWRQSGPGAARRITMLNARWDSLPVIAPEIVRYRSVDGQAIEGALLLPADRAPNARLPLVVLVHGGPTGAWGDRFEGWGQLLAAKGYAVFYPNPRGSTGYGFAFLAANRADWGGRDFQDIMAGVDELVRRGVADPSRLGIGGWSYGGYMASWAITQTDRFKAAVTGAGMSDLATEFGTEAGPAYDEWFYGTPYERPDGFRKSSPLTYITRAHTPTLILQGEDDTTDPLAQSQMLYRALKRYDVPAELVVYPREGHGLREEKHLLDRTRRFVAWFDRWLH